MIRLATPKDAPGMLEIYRPYVETTSITFETETPSIAAFEARIAHYLLKYPWLVYESGGEIAGYAYASQYRERIAYQWSVECSVYISSRFRKLGIATKLYSALFSVLRRQGFRNVYAVINLPNAPSVALHESLGFTWFATYEKVGYKLGKWKNVGWWQLQLNDYTDEPPAPVDFPAIGFDPE